MRDDFSRWVEYKGIRMAEFRVSDAINGLIERGHQNLVDALAKLTAPLRKPGAWPAEASGRAAGPRYRSEV